MNKFKIGQIVKLRTDGEIGLHNKVAHGYYMDKTLVITRCYDNGSYMVVFANVQLLVSEYQIEIPELKPKFHGIQIGQYLEIYDPSVKGKCYTTYVVDIDGDMIETEHTPDCIFFWTDGSSEYENVRILRIVPAKEVKIKLELSDSRIICNEDNKIIAVDLEGEFYISDLSENSRLEVERLLKQIEIENKVNNENKTN